MEGYSVTEAASVLGVPTERVWELLARGVLSGASDGESGMRVFLQPRPAPQLVDEPRASNGHGSARGTEAEASPFRELLTEFRGLTERYGQALLALGEARGEVASLRSRVDVLEARMDLRLPFSSPMTAEPARRATDRRRPGPADAVEHETMPEHEAAVEVEPDEERSPRRRRTRAHFSDEFADALARAEDPSPAVLRDAPEAEKAVADDHERGESGAEAEAADWALPRELPAAEAIAVAESAPEPKPEAEWAREPGPDIAVELEARAVVETPAGPEPARAHELGPEGELRAEALPRAEQEPVLEAQPEPVLEAEVEPEPEPAVLEAQPEPVLEAEVEPEPEPAVLEAQPELVLEAEVEPEPEPEPVLEAAAEPEPEPMLEAVSEPEPVLEAVPEPEPVLEAVPEPEPEPVPEPVLDVEPELEPAPVLEPELELEPVLEAEPAREPEAEPESPPVAAEEAVLAADVVEREAVAEDEPAADFPAESAAEIESEPAAQPDFEPRAADGAAPVTESEPQQEPSGRAAGEAEPGLDALAAVDGEPSSEPSWDQETYSARIEEPDWWTPEESLWPEPEAASSVTPSPEAPAEEPQPIAFDGDGWAGHDSASGWPPPESDESAAGDEAEEAVVEVDAVERQEPTAAATGEVDEQLARSQPYVGEETMLWFGRRPEGSGSTEPPDDAAGEMEVASTGHRGRVTSEPGAGLPGGEELDDALAGLDSLVGRRRPDAVDPATMPRLEAGPEPSGMPPRVGAQPVPRPPQLSVPSGPATRAYRRLRRIFPG